MPDKPFLNFAATKNTGFSSRLSSTFIDRLRPGQWAGPVLGPGDLTLSIKLIELSEPSHPEAPDLAYQALYDLIYQLPIKAKMPDGLPELAQFEAKLRNMQTKAFVEDGHLAIRNWLCED